MEKEGCNLLAVKYSLLLTCCRQQSSLALRVVLSYSAMHFLFANPAHPASSVPYRVYIYSIIPITNLRPFFPLSRTRIFMQRRFQHQLCVLIDTRGVESVSLSLPPNRSPPLSLSLSLSLSASLSLSLSRSPLSLFSPFPYQRLVCPSKRVRRPLPLKYFYFVFYYFKLRFCEIFQVLFRV